MSVRRRIPVWRLVGAAFLHFCVPAYLIATLLDALSKAPPTLAAFLREVVGFTPWFLGAFAAITATATAGAALFDAVASIRRLPSRADPKETHARLNALLAQCRGKFGPAAEEQIALLSRETWNFADGEQRHLAATLEETLTSTLEAFATAAPSQRESVVTLATDTLTRIVAARAALAEDKARDAERKARTLARYVELRYPSDFASGDD